MGKHHVNDWDTTTTFVRSKISLKYWLPLKNNLIHNYYSWCFGYQILKNMLYLNGNNQMTSQATCVTQNTPVLRMWYHLAVPCLFSWISYLRLSWFSCIFFLQEGCRSLTDAHCGYTHAKSIIWRARKLEERCGDHKRRVI
jgi:hypothetical protein